MGRIISTAEFSGPGIAWVCRPMPLSTFELPPELKALQNQRFAEIQAIKERHGSPIIEPDTRLIAALGCLEIASVETD